MINPKDQAEGAAQLVEPVHAAADPGERPALEHVEHLQYPADIEASTEDPRQVRRGQLRSRLPLRGQGHPEPGHGYHTQPANRNRAIALEGRHRFFKVRKCY